MAATSGIVIANPKAAADPLLREAVESMRQRGHVLEVNPTWEAGDGARLCREALAKKAKRIIAAGGDGLLNEVANSLLTTDTSTDACLGTLPYGTANDFARANGIDPALPRVALQTALEAGPTRIDVVRCNDRYFINSCTAGFGAEVTSDTQSGAKNLLGSFSYLLSALAKAPELTPYQLEIDCDDVHWRGEAVGFALTNGRQAGGGIVVSPDAKLDDGVFDGLLFRSMSLSSTLYLLQQLSTGERPASNGDVERLHGRNIRIRSNRPLPMTLDGEPVIASEFELSLEPRRLNLALPVDSPLLSMKPGKA